MIEYGDSSKPAKTEQSIAQSLTRTIRSREYQRLLRQLAELSNESTLVYRWQHVLSAMAVIEMNQRPAVIRFFEWLFRSLFGRFHTFTCGPLQMSRAPFDRRTMLHVAAERLEASGSQPTLSDPHGPNIARSWHGASTRQPGSAMGYLTALRLAETLLNSSE